ncbi:hypothetical protein [Virgisporangium aliadipatigenens]|nr:hypothetical protein [Virgisporangium aliadipatigenens]
MPEQQSAAGSHQGSGRGRYLVGADDPNVLRALAERIGAGEFAPPGEAIVVRTIGAAPDVLVVEAEPAVAQRLRAEYPDRLTVESDELLPEPGTVLPPGLG